MLEFNDDTLGVIFYRKPITLFQLDKFLFNDLLQQFRKVNDKKDFSEVTIDALHQVLKTISDDALVNHKEDFNIILELRLSPAYDVTLHLIANKTIIHGQGDNNFFMKINLSQLNTMKSYVLTERNLEYCLVQYDIFKILKKIDSFMEYKSQLYDSIINNGLYPSLSFLTMDCFKFKFNQDIFSIQSLFEANLDGTIKLPFFKIESYKKLLTFRLAGQVITLTETEFLATANQDIWDIFKKLLAMKNIPINSIENVKDYLLIQDMKII